MKDVANRAIAAILVVVHAGLGLWAIVGFAELLAPSVPWPELSNPLFSTPMLLFHWTAIAAAAVTFLSGWFARWRLLPWAMAVCYAFMAAVCAVQTVFVLVHDSRFVDMALEYAAYLAILAWLFFSPLVRERLAGTPRLAQA